jgi:ABC-2 type transport system ATP-binding protein
MSALLEAVGLTKHYRHHWTFHRIRALEGLDLQVREDEIFGLIGPNGAGKTTTFKLFLGFLRPSRGRVEFLGKPIAVADRVAIGFLPEQPYFYDHLTVRETLHFYARLYGLTGGDARKRVADLIERLGLTPKSTARLRTLSKGTLQRVGIAQAILNRPKLVILDEPMSGLDPAGRRFVRDLILSLRNEGTTVIFSSHILPDAEVLCDRVGILANGKLCDTVKLQRDTEITEYVMTAHGLDSEALIALERIASGPPAANGNHWIVRLSSPEAVQAALDAVRRRQGVLDSLVPARPSLEERFLAHVKQGTDLD